MRRDEYLLFEIIAQNKGIRAREIFSDHVKGFKYRRIRKYGGHATLILMVSEGYLTASENADRNEARYYKTESGVISYKAYRDAIWYRRVYCWPLWKAANIIPFGALIVSIVALCFSFYDKSQLEKRVKTLETKTKQIDSAVGHAAYLTDSALSVLNQSYPNHPDSIEAQASLP